MSDVLRVPETFSAVSPGVHNGCVHRVAELEAEVEVLWRVADEARAGYVHSMCGRQVDRCEGDFTVEQMDAWEVEYTQIWDERHPAIAPYRERRQAQQEEDGR